MYLDILIQLWNDGTIYFMLGAAVVIIALAKMLYKSLED